MTAALVYLIGTRSGVAGGAGHRAVRPDPTLGLVLAGAAVAACLASVTTLLVTGRSSVLAEVLPFLLVGLLAALPLGRSVNIVGLGEDAAAGLGLRVGRTQLAARAAPSPSATACTVRPRIHGTDRKASWRTNADPIEASRSARAPLRQ